TPGRVMTAVEPAEPGPGVTATRIAPGGMIPRAPVPAAVAVAAPGLAAPAAVVDQRPVLEAEREQARADRPAPERGPQALGVGRSRPAQSRRQGAQPGEE